MGSGSPIVSDVSTPSIVETGATLAPARPARWAVASAAFAVLAALTSAYLVYVHYQPSALVCNIANGCETVQSSDYATIGPIPIALLGLGMYLAALALGWVRWRQPARAESVTVAIFGMVLAGVAYFAYLTYVELFVLEAICQWCVITSIFTVGMLIAEGIGLWRLYGTIDDDL